MIFPRVYFLQEDEQLVVHAFTRRWAVNGPGMFVARPFWRVKRRRGKTLDPTDYLQVRDTLTGALRNEIGPKLIMLGINDEVVQEAKAVTLEPTDYLRVRNTVTGELRNEFGPQLFFPGIHDEVVKKFKAIALKHDEYLRLVNTQMGLIRVEKGEKTVYLGPTESILEDVRKGVNVDEETAVLLRDTNTGQLDLFTQQQVFFPVAHQEIVEIRQRIRLEDNEAVIIKDKNGRYIFKRVSDRERTFFLQPYEQLVQLRWSTGIHKDKRNLVITKLDLRPKFMWYEFEARTQDNVELIIGVTFFWEVSSLEDMIAVTDDAPGDICSHARSAIIQAISQVSLEQFLAAFNNVIRQAVLEGDIAFYTDRGIKLHAVEVRSVACKDAATQRVLQEIINETTNRINRLQKQVSENEVEIRRMQGKIEAEQMRSQLLEIQRQHAQTEGLIAGESEGMRIRAFLDGLGENMTISDKIAVFNTLRKQDIFDKLSHGDARLYLTPQDVNLRIDSD